MRVSLLSSAYSTLGANGSTMPIKKVEQAALFRQSRSGVLPAFWADRGGNEYCPTVSTVWDSAIAGLALSSDDVFVSDQVSSWFEVRGPTATPFPWASSAAFE